MRRPREHATPVGGDDTQYRSAHCHAFGCPLPGGLSHSTLGGGPWFCRFHFGRERHEDDAITEEVRRMKASGELDAPRGDTLAVAEMRKRLKPGYGRSA